MSNKKSFSAPTVDVGCMFGTIKSDGKTVTIPLNVARDAGLALSLIDRHLVGAKLEAEIILDPASAGDNPKQGKLLDTAQDRHQLPGAETGNVTIRVKGKGYRLSIACQPSAKVRDALFDFSNKGGRLLATRVGDAGEIVDEEFADDKTGETGDAEA